MAGKISKIRRGILQQAFLRCLSEGGKEGIHYDKILDYISRTLDLTDYERSPNPKGDARWKVFMAFGAIPLVKLGYVLREKNVFCITEKGRKALEMDPAELRDELKRLWKELEDSSPKDADETDLMTSTATQTETEDYVEAPNYLKNERTVFKRVDYDLAALLNYIDIGDIGLHRPR